MADGVRIARLIYQIYFSLLAVTLLTLTIVSFMKYDEASIFYDLIIENWQTDPLVDIRLTDQSCSQLEDSLTAYFWPGTMDGCDCRDVQRRLFEHRILGIKKIIYNDHICNSTQEDAGCKSIHGKEAFNMNYFPDPTGKTGIELCGKRDTKNSFYNVGTNLKGCTSTQKLCGDQQNYFYCVDESQKCPITSFLFTNQTIEDQESIELPFDQQLIISRLDSNLPLVQLRVAEGDGVCMNNHQKSITNGRSDYPLMNSQKIECGKDPRFKLLYKVYESDFYYVNRRDNLSTELSGYEISNNYEWGIECFYARNYIQWNQECRGDVMQEFIDLGGTLDIIWDQEVDLMIIGIIFFFFMGFLFPVISLIICCDCCCEGEQTLACIMYIEVGFKIILQVAFTVIAIISFITTNEVISFLNKIIVQKCSDEITQQEFSDFQTLLQNNVYNFNIAYLVLFIISTILDCCVLMVISAKFLCKIIKRNRYKPGVPKINNKIQFQMPEAPKIENNIHDEINHANESRVIQPPLTDIEMQQLQDRNKMNRQIDYYDQSIPMEVTKKHQPYIQQEQQNPFQENPIQIQYIQPQYGLVQLQQFNHYNPDIPYNEQPQNQQLHPQIDPQQQQQQQQQYFQYPAFPQINQSIPLGNPMEDNNADNDSNKPF